MIELFFSVFGKYPKGKNNGVGILKKLYVGPVIICFLEQVLSLFDLIE